MSIIINNLLFLYLIHFCISVLKLPNSSVDIRPTFSYPITIIRATVNSHSLVNRYP